MKLFDSIYNMEIRTLNMEKIKWIMRADNNMFMYNFRQRVIIGKQLGYVNDTVLSEQAWRYIGRGVKEHSKGIVIPNCIEETCYVDTETGDEVHSRELTEAEKKEAKRLGIIREAYKGDISSRITLYSKKDTYSIKDIEGGENISNIEKFEKYMSDKGMTKTCSIEEFIDKVYGNRNGINSELVVYSIQTYINGSTWDIKEVDTYEEEIESTYMALMKIYNKIDGKHIDVSNNELETANTMKRIIEATYIKRRCDMKRYSKSNKI